jgi:uncharacterized membrane protein
MFWKGFVMQFMTGLFIFLWTLLFIIPGIIAAYRYSMTSYILLENPDMPVMDAIRRSKEMMDGNKGRLFCLDISFIGWWLLCILTCGLGFLWLYPYMNAATVAFYNEVSGKNYYRYQSQNGYNNNGFSNNGYNNGFNNNGYNNNGYNNDSYHNTDTMNPGNNNWNNPDQNPR